MRIRTPIVALAVASVTVSTFGLAQSAEASTARPSVNEVPFTSIDKSGINEPGARDSSEQTAAVHNRSTTNLPGIFMAQNMGLSSSTGASSVVGDSPEGSLSEGSDQDLASNDGKNDDQKPATEAPSQTPKPTQPGISGSAKDKTEDGVTIASISRALKVPAGNPSVVGVSYSGSAHVEFEVRTKVGETWGAWEDLEQENTGEGQPGTEPFIVAGGANSVQMRVLGDAAAPDAKLILVDPKKSSADAAAVANNAPVPATAGEAAAGTNSVTPAEEACDDSGCTGVENATNVAFEATNTAAGKVSKPKIASRKAWGANERMRNDSPSYAPKVKAAVIHHTEGSNSYSAGDVPGIIRGIYTFHTKGRGWADVGYNVLVDKYGRLWQGRAGDIDRAVIGAHAQGFNTGTFGISVMGSYTKKAPSAEALNALEHAIAWKLKGVDAKGRTTVNGRTIRTITTHRDVGNTDCPGDAFYARTGEIRNAVSKMQRGQAPTPPKKKPAKKLTPIQTAYKGQEKVLGKAKGKEVKWGDGYVQKYERGYITWMKSSGAVTLRGGMADAWARNRANIGLPVQNKKTIKRGSYQKFQRGVTYSSSATGTHSTWGTMWKYWKDKGLERGHMGYPTSEPKKSGGQVEQSFEGARVLYTEGFGTVEYAPGPMIRGGVKDNNATPQPGEKPKNAPKKDKPKEAPKQKEKPKDKPKDKPKEKPKDKPKKSKDKAPSSDEIRRDIVKEARKHIGTPYVWGGNTPSGWDCSGFTRYVYGKFGINLPRTSGEQRYAGKVVSTKNAKPGDIIWVPGHVGIVSDPKGLKMVDAGSRRTDTSERSYEWMLNRGGKIIRVVEG